MTCSPLDTYLAETARPWPHTALHAIITAVRASADLDEAIKWGQPYFSMNEHAVLKLYAAREWINLFYYRGAELPDPDGQLTGEGSSRMRRQRVHRDNPDLPLVEIQRRLPLPGKALVLGVSLALSMFPQISIVAPLYLVMINLGLLDTYEGLSGVYIGLSLPLMIFVLYGHLRSIPFEMDEAASIDGASRVKTLTAILLPLAAPGVVTAGLLGFIANWNEFLLALSFTSVPQRQTIPVGIANFQSQYFIPWGDMAAASVVVTIPLVLLVLFFQRRLVAGITAGGVKE